MQGTSALPLRIGMFCIQRTLLYDLRARISFQPSRQDKISLIKNNALLPLSSLPPSQVQALIKLQENI